MRFIDRLDKKSRERLYQIIQTLRGECIDAYVEKEGLGAAILSVACDAITDEIKREISKLSFDLETFDEDVFFLPEREYVSFIDIETTGLILKDGDSTTVINDGRQPDIIEFCAYQPKHLHEWTHFYLKPKKGIPLEIKKLTGIIGNESTVGDMYNISESLSVTPLLPYCNGCRRIICWNADFDVNVMNMNFSRENSVEIRSKSVLCLMRYVTKRYPEIVRRHAGENKFVRLIDAYKYFYPDSSTEQKHNAKADVEMLYAVYEACKRKEEENK